VIPIVTPEEMRAIDAAAPEPVEELIDRAGRAAARVALAMLGGAYGRVVDVVAGGGNNGNDGRTAGEYLSRRGVMVRVIDAAACPPELPPCDLVIDAAYGTGFRGRWVAPRIVTLAGERPMVLAVDIPSGVDALTGAADDGVLAADRTVTFQALKPGLLFGAGRGLSGDVTVVDIGLDVSSARRHLVGRDDVAAWLPERRSDAHKWHGAVRVVAGSPGMLGAGRLCAAAAARTGAGLVALSSPGLDPGARSEIIQRRIPAAAFADDVLDDLDRFDALAIGPGLGREPDTITSVRRLIAEAPLPVVIDGDGIFATAWDPEETAGGSSAGPPLRAAALLASRTHPTVITPHDGEYALLTGAPPDADRVAAARELASHLGVVVLLKGPTTVVADPDGAVLVVDHGDERLATAGSGDVLTGMIAALLAADVEPRLAAAAAAWLHADAAALGPRRGLLAGDIVELMPRALAGLIAP
jgi:NAD(P)H-hydrate epimerase